MLFRKEPPEPRRDSNICNLDTAFAHKLESLLSAMKVRGFDPIVFEGKRSFERQRWLYGKGRTHHLKSKPVTWTMHSQHLKGKAADVISKRYGWNFQTFYYTLRKLAPTFGLEVLRIESCHVQMPDEE